MMSKDKNKRQLLPLLNYYLQLDSKQVAQARELKQSGRWPTLDLEALHRTTSEGYTAVGNNDIELYTRHQVQQWCPDVLITNYSMLEYMLMRPIEQTIFQQTASWLAQDQANTLLIVLDEAHLYSGVTGAEIALLLRRLQARLGVQRERIRYILTSASLDLGEQGPSDILDFATTLVGARGASKNCFAVIQGKRLDPPRSDAQSNLAAEADALAHFDLQAFANRAADPEAAQATLVSLATQLNWPTSGITENLPGYLGQQLPHLQTFQHLWKSTAGNAIPFQQLAQLLFSSLDTHQRSLPTSALLSLAAAARTTDERPLLPVRAHLFFRGLPPLYACINPRCSRKKAVDGSPGILGSLWLSPRLHCDCGARVYELYAHRNCGALFLRTFSSSTPGSARFYWHEPGKGTEQLNETLLLIGQPHPKADQYELIDLHLMTGRAIPAEPTKPWISQEQDFIRVYRPIAIQQRKGKKDMATSHTQEEYWQSCPVCRKQRLNHAISSLSTKGEQPFVNLVRRQFELQPPATSFHEAAPNRGRKVLLFSDGRQRAARLARDLPREVELDTFRQALLLAVEQSSLRKKDPLVRIDEKLYSEFIAICAKYRLYFFDGESQKDLLHRMQDLREDYNLDIEQALDEEWEPPIPQAYRMALLRQVADPFYSMQRICAAVVEPTPASLRQLKRKSFFTRLTDQQLRALAIYWIEELLEESAFDMNITPQDRENTVPGSSFDYADLNWNDAEKAAQTLLGYQNDDLQILRRSLVDELCEKKQERAFLNPKKLALRLTLEESWHQCQDCARLIWLPLDGKCPNPRCGSTRLIKLPGNDPSLRARTDFYREPIRQVIAGNHAPRHMTAEEHTAQLSYRDIQQVSTTTEVYELRFQDIGISADQPSIDVLSCTTTMEVGIDIGSLLGIGLRTMPPRRANYQQRAGRAGRRSAALATVLTYSENGSHDAHYFSHPEEMISGALPCPQISPINQRLLRRHIQAALIQTYFLEQMQSHKIRNNKQAGYLAEALGPARTFFSSTEPPSLVGFTQWLKEVLEGSTPSLMPQIAAWLSETSDGVSRNERFVREVANTLVINLHALGSQLFPSEPSVNKNTKNSKNAKNADTQEEAFPTDNDEMLLNVLFEHDFLPTYAFPREVRSFVIEKLKEGADGKRRIGIEQRPQQSVDIALSEYAPGRELIVDKATYRVGGIYVDPFPGSTLTTRVSSHFHRPATIFVLCMKCGYTRVKQPDEQQGRHCPLCDDPLMIQEILDPPGYAPERARSLEQSQLRNDKTRNGDAMQVKLVLLPDASDTFNQCIADGRIAWTCTDHHQLLIVNSGNDNQGFSICRACGAGAQGDPTWLHQNHQRPFLIPPWMSAARLCTGPQGIWQGYLGHVFYSDLLMLRLQWPTGVAYQIGSPWMRDALDTLAQAFLLAATRLLDISTSELQAGWSYSTTAQENLQERVAYLFLFDTLSGGAGYATQVGQHIERLLKETQNILADCPDQCERSCYRCLRTYQNRMLHHRLDRQLAGTLLKSIVSGLASEAFSVARQIEELQMLQHYFELNGAICQQSVVIQGVTVPLQVKAQGKTLLLGAYPVQQDLQVNKHPLSALSGTQVQCFNDYELAHNLPQIAQTLLL
jgi:hypothetical protein